MQAILLAAGESSRFWPLEGRHKSLFRIMGKSLILRTIGSISLAGIKDIIVVHRQPNIEKSITSPSGVSLRFVLQPEPKGMGDAILCAKELISGSFFVVTPYHFNAGRLIEKMLAAGKTQDIVLAGKKTATPEIYGIFRLAGTKAVGVVEKPAKGRAPSDIRVVGIYLLSKEFILRLEAENSARYVQSPKVIERIENQSHMHKDFHYSFESALGAELKEKPAELIITDDFQPSIKYPWDLFSIERRLMEESLKKSSFSGAIIDKTAKIQGNVFIGKGTKVLENAVIKGPCYIGENCVIGNNALLRDCVDVGDSVIIGANTEAARSIICSGTHIHSGFIGDSIIGENCRIGAGILTANTRADRKEIYSVVKGEKIATGLKSFGTVIGSGTKTGIGVKIMPGMLIGSNCIIGPGTVVSGNVDSDSRYYSEFKGVVKKKITR